MDAKEILALLSASELAEQAGVTESTARRWKASGTVPEPLRRLLELAVLGCLDRLGWQGWRIVRGELVSREGWTFGPGDVMSLPLLRQQLAALKARVRAFEQLDAQPESQDADAIMEKIAAG